MAKIMKTNPSQFCCFKHLVERTSEIAFIPPVTKGREKHPVLYWLSRHRRFKYSSVFELLQAVRELRRQIHPPDLACFRRRELSSHDRSSDLNEPTMNIHVAPLQANEFSLAQSGAEPRIRPHDPFALSS